MLLMYGSCPIGRRYVRQTAVSPKREMVYSVVARTAAGEMSPAAINIRT